MNRCPDSAQASAPILSRHFLAALLASLLSVGLVQAALAEESVRKFPPQAERGIMQITQPPELLMNGKPERLSPGARIRSAGNVLVLSSHLAGQGVLVNFVREPHGLVHEVWILNATEAALPAPGEQRR